MMRYGHKTIIFLINNGGYTIEVEIHDGPYNVIHNWNYTAMVEAISNGQGACWTTKVHHSWLMGVGGMVRDSDHRFGTESKAFI